jgi:hypothetical protein
MFVGKRNIGHERIRLTVNEIKGVALSDKTKPLSEYIKTDSAILFFKDLGL